MNIKLIYKNMSRYRFYSNCPVCLEDERFYWVHACDDGDDYIWDNCDLECDKCKSKSFILHHRFKCGKHNEYKEVDAFQLVEAISSLANIPNINSDTRRKMRDILKSYCKI